MFLLLRCFLLRYIIFALFRKEELELIIILWFLFNHFLILLFSSKLLNWDYLFFRFILIWFIIFLIIFLFIFLINILLIVLILLSEVFIRFLNFNLFTMIFLFWLVNDGLRLLLLFIFVTRIFIIIITRIFIIITRIFIIIITRIFILIIIIFLVLIVLFSIFKIRTYNIRYFILSWNCYCSYCFI